MSVILIFLSFTLRENEKCFSNLILKENEMFLKITSEANKFERSECGSKGSGALGGGVFLNLREIGEEECSSRTELFSKCVIFIHAISKIVFFPTLLKRRGGSK